MLKAMDAVVDRVLAVYEALIPTQKHFANTRPRYFGCALKVRSSPPDLPLNLINKLC